MERKDTEGNLYLTGFMGSGKSSVGEELAKLLHRVFIDTDREIERRMGMSIPQIFVLEGEAIFRTLEGKIVEELSQKKGIVVALGGGTFMDPENRKKVLNSGTVVFLKIDLEESLRRIDRSDRPLAHDAVALFHDRIATYEQAHLQIDAGVSTPKEIAEKIREKLL